MKIKLSEEFITILEMIAEGKTNQEIAFELNYTTRNVEYKINKLFQLYKVKNRIHLASEYLLEKLGNF